MSKYPVIDINGVSKTYKLYSKPSDRVKEAFNPVRRKYHDKFDALDNISFSVKKGESIGIIGRNGSGKSTLLQIICGILKPTSGSVLTKGSIGALLELGAGFNPEFTGRQNVYINCSILGMDEEYIEKKYSEIVRFADIGTFIDQPVKLYSSGMYVRLAFAVQIAINPNILVIDEALSVGDFFFQQKCMQRIHELLASGTTLVFVSHDMASVRDLCTKVLYLKKGKQEYFGDSQEAIRRYYHEYSELRAIKDEDCEECPTVDNQRQYIEIIDQSIWQSNESTEIDKQAAKILAVSVEDAQGLPTTKVYINDELVIKILFKNHTDNALHASLALKNKYNQVVNSSSTLNSGLKAVRFEKDQVGYLAVKIRFNIEAGQYGFKIGLGLEGDMPNRGHKIDKTPWLGPLTVKWEYDGDWAPFLGMFDVPTEFSFGKIID